MLLLHKKILMRQEATGAARWGNHSTRSLHRVEPLSHVARRTQQKWTATLTPDFNCLGICRFSNALLEHNSTIRKLRSVHSRLGPRSTSCLTELGSFGLVAMQLPWKPYASILQRI